ncbi:hypothetical protein BHU72_14215 [Desulfuribacillus stibiiarsenatis]|uniref:DNA 3'-5' helicase n=1 Tax=Desulfuribacillus stibiiarsenatis TaxID=1390249 RepID=A0A1E5L7W5_9FIRM|nr:helicase-related protein [Desulfuribacillus stibiiarsenatis]OEH86079.1 hypothetical protein BHU72_14215 [Desulfuribacillus stibiiarsenatis]
MTLPVAISERLVELFAEWNHKSTRTLVFFKGFSNIFYQEVLRIEPNQFQSNTNTSDDRYINIPKLIENSRNLPRLFYTIDKKVTWGYYEEFLLLSESINDIKEQFEGDVIVVDNNLFDRYYIVDIEQTVKDKLLQYFNSEKTEADSNIQDYTRLFSHAIKYSNDHIGVAYINRHVDQEVENINFYPDQEDVESIYFEDKRANTRVISVSEAEFVLFKDRLQRDGQYQDVQLIINAEKDLCRITSVAYLYQKSNARLTVIKHNQFSQFEGLDENKHLPILHQYWGKECSFRELKFYRNPDYTNDLINISQGHIISDIIQQSVKALDSSEEWSDIFVTAPTGAGKSLLFQVPAIHLAEKHNAVTIVVTPLKALMLDQVLKLQEEHGISYVTSINSDISFQEKETRINKIKEGEISLIYLSPELLLGTSIENIIGERIIGLFVIDEAHLVTTWGRDFRADYWFMSNYLYKMRVANQKKFPVLCLTATAVYMGSEDMVFDTITSLNLRNHNLYLGYVRRDNIGFEIHSYSHRSIEGSVDDFKIEKTRERIQQFLSENKKAIVYCPYKKQVNDIYNALDEHTQRKVSMYHAGIDAEERQAAQEAFKYGNSRIMIATKAFGMGVDISDIEVVYHFAPTGNLADYVQEIGRVARKEAISGLATTDFTDKDMKYVRMLHGLSGMKQYQLKEIIGKLYHIQREKKSRNFLISPDMFSYLFSEQELENKVKNGLLLISKDLEDKYGFPVVIVRPKSVYTKNFINVPMEIESEFLAKYKQYAVIINKVPPRIVLSKNQWAGDTVITDTGNIYEFDMAKMWEENYGTLSFPQFKWKFYKGELFDFSQEAKVAPRVNIVIHYKDNFDILQQKFSRDMDV